MNKEQALERLPALELELKQIRGVLEAPEKKNDRWRAEVRDIYWIIDSGGDVSFDNEEYTTTDNDRFNAFNYFQTEDEAERISKVQKAFRVLDWAIRQFETTAKTEQGYEFYLRNGFVSYWATTDKHSTLPKLDSEDCVKHIITNYQAELLTFLTGGEK